MILLITLLILVRMMSRSCFSVVVYLIMTIRDELLDDNLLFRFGGPCSVVVVVVGAAGRLRSEKISLESWWGLSER
jgi:hypothetical protein